MRLREQASYLLQYLFMIQAPVMSASFVYRQLRSILLWFAAYKIAIRILPMIVTDVDEIRVIETQLGSARYFVVSYEMIATIRREGFIAIFSFSTEYQYRISVPAHHKLQYLES